MDSKTPLVSVVIPAYNCSRTLKRAIDSALEQDVSMEILVLDNGGTEDLTQVMAEYRGNSEMKKIWVLQAHAIAGLNWQEGHMWHFLTRMTGGRREN